MKHPARWLLLLVLASFTIITLDAGRAGPVDRMRAAAGVVMAPLQDGTRAVVRPVLTAAGDLAAAGRRGAELRRLHAENARLREELALAGEARPAAGNARPVPPVDGHRVVPARVVAYASNRTFARTVTIDAGRRDGVRADLTVLSDEGLVGRVLRAGPATATVLLAADAESVVGARVEGSRELGFLRGDGDLGGSGRMSLTLLDHTARVRPGDRVLSWGSRGGSPYLAGVPLGRVTAVAASPTGTARTATVLPAVGFTSLDLVGVVVDAGRP